MITEAFIASLIIVESAGNPAAVGDHGSAVGSLQIQKGVIEDVNRIYKTRYIPADRRDAEKSKAIARYYLTYWTQVARNRDRRARNLSTAQIAARIWNGGPTGYRKRATLAYWQKVQRTLQKEEGIR